jgi:predicted SnoaL-like aldol condensation-catalyzing enzyme
MDRLVDGAVALLRPFRHGGFEAIQSVGHLRAVLRVLAEGDFVLLHSEGEFGVPVAYWDLFRVADGKIVEHWDIIDPIPAEIRHGNGLF